MASSSSSFGISSSSSSEGYSGSSDSSSMSSSSSSSIDSSSSSSIDSSSTSSFDEEFRELRGIVINQGNNNLIPFTFIAEGGTSSDLGDDAKISFTIEASNSPDIDYEAIINRDNSGLLTTPDNATPTVYLPEDERAKYKHEQSFKVDIIAKDASGIKAVRTHVDPDKYEFEDVDSDEVHFIPRFTWEN